jgi:hypothetical protein
MSWSADIRFEEGPAGSWRIIKHVVSDSPILVLSGSLISSSRAASRIYICTDAIPKIWAASPDG